MEKRKIERFALKTTTKFSQINLTKTNKYLRYKKLTFRIFYVGRFSPPPVSKCGSKDDYFQNPNCIVGLAVLRVEQTSHLSDSDVLAYQS